MLLLNWSLPCEHYPELFYVTLCKIKNCNTSKFIITNYFLKTFQDFYQNLQRERKRNGHLRRPVSQLTEDICFKLLFLGFFVNYILLTQIQTNQIIEGRERIDVMRQGWENWD